MGGRVISTTIDRGYPPALAPRQAAGPLDATVTVPGSKSITNRALIAAALADGPSELVGALHCDDTRYMAAALNALGVTVESDEANACFRNEGGGGTFTTPDADLFVGNSGTTMRFLTAALPLGGGRYRIDGVPRMRLRPIAPLIAALNDLGADARSEAGTGLAAIFRREGWPAATQGDRSCSRESGRCRCVDRERALSAPARCASRTNAAPHAADSKRTDKERA